MQEILDYLHDKENYALFAGFAAFIHTGIEPSPDIDIFVHSREDIETIIEDFTQNGWKNIKYEKSVLFTSATLEKNSTTFDLIFSASSREPLLSSKVKVQFQERNLYTISCEALLLTKMAQITSFDRSPQKTERDRKVIHILRKKIKVETVRELLQNLSDTFWTEGYF